jgi:hypothetical protein
VGHMARSALGVRSALIHQQMLELERSVALEPFPITRPLFGGDDPTLRDVLLRTGAVWLIAWSTILAAITWLPRLATG